MLEEAYEQKKEIWILFMNISKAYDSVSGEIMIKALRRIKIPEIIISLITDIFDGWLNKIIVKNDLSNDVIVEDGLDQGEVWSPILWRIFYDPLLKALKKETIGYEMKVEKKYGIMKFKCNHISFINDSTNRVYVRS